MVASRDDDYDEQERFRQITRASCHAYFDCVILCLNNTTNSSITFCVRPSPHYSVQVLRDTHTLLIT